MFLCKRQIDIHSRFGLPRIAFLSFVSTIIMFLICYEIMYYFSNTPLSDHYFTILLCAVIALYPIHKCIHLLFFISYYKSFKIHQLSKSRWLPFFNIYVSQPINKYYFCLNLLLPFIIITGIFIRLIMSHPEFGHYFVFLIALNFGYSITDFLYLKLILFSNYGNYIEEHQSGINILTKATNKYVK